MDVVEVRAVVRLRDPLTQVLGRSCHVVRTEEGLALGTIYRQSGDVLCASEADEVVALRSLGHEVTLHEVENCAEHSSVTEESEQAR